VIKLLWETIKYIPEYHRDRGESLYWESIAAERELIADGWSVEDAAKRTQFARAWAKLVYSVGGGDPDKLDQSQEQP
jgi:hypothetical protein